MRRAKQVFERIPERANLELALRKALRGKRRKGDARAYVANAEENLNALAAQIRGGRLVVGRATQFTIYDPKERLITAPCFAERVLHHAIMNICEPEFERRLIHHSYACRQGKGQFAALEAAARFARRNEWFLKADVRKYFESIPKAGLLARLERVFGDVRVLDMFGQILHAHRPGEARGLPIGSLISQHLANLYLDPVDRFAAERQSGGAYVRYMDDFVLWSSEKSRLKDARAALSEELGTLGLEVKNEPFLNRTRHGMDFLGHRVGSRRVALNRRSRLRFARRLKALETALEAVDLAEGDAQKRALALCAFTERFGGAEFRRRAMLSDGRLPKAPTA